jgi:hypothetical protein
MRVRPQLVACGLPLLGAWSLRLELKGGGPQRGPMISR